MRRHGATYLADEAYTQRGNKYNNARRRACTVRPQSGVEIAARAKFLFPRCAFVVGLHKLHNVDFGRNPASTVHAIAVTCVTIAKLPGAARAGLS